MGELDLVLYKDGQLVFAEVKTRAGRMLDAPAAAVDARKQRRLIFGGPILPAAQPLCRRQHPL